MPDTKTANQQRLKAITDGIEQSIRELFQSDKYLNYLSVMSRFHNYSLNNVILIHSQCPNASHVAGYEKWKKQFGRHVKRGEKGIQILAPTPIKRKVEEIQIDPVTQRPIYDENGNPLTEEKTVLIPRYKVVSVFDYSQTEGKPLPSLVSSLTGNVEQFDVFMEALRRSSPVPIEFAELPSNTDGLFSRTNQNIKIREGMSEVQTICAAIHEIAHSKLHNYEKAAEATGDKAVQPKDSRTEETEAESVSYAVCQYYGIDTSENSLGYIASWSKDKELKELRNSLETINKTASGLISDIDKHFAAICKERGIDQKSKAEQEQPDTPELFAADLYECINRLYQNGKITNGPIGSKEESIAGYMMLIQNGSFDALRKELTDISVINRDRTAAALLGRVEKFNEAWNQKLTYEMLDYPLSSGRHDNSFIREFIPDESDNKHSRLVFVGSAEECQELAQKLNDRMISVEEVLKMNNERTYSAENTVEVKQPDSELHPSVETEVPEPAPVIVTDIPSELPEQPVSDQPKQTPDDYPPDPAITQQMMKSYGYFAEDMLPMSKDRALELMEKEVTIYLLYHNNTEEMALDQEDIAGHVGIFGIASEEWEAAKADIPPRDVEKRFMENPHDAVLIYQHNDSASVDRRFTALDRLDSPPMRNEYDPIYTADLTQFGKPAAILEKLFEQYNLNHPGDFTGHSMSTGDIVALKQGDKVSYHYCDSYGFQELPAFNQPENYLKNAEMAIPMGSPQSQGLCGERRSDGMSELSASAGSERYEVRDDEIDGIINNGPKQPTVDELEAQVKAGQSISLLDLANAAHAEVRSKKAVKPVKRKSVLERLNSPLPQQKKSQKSALQKSAERNR